MRNFWIVVALLLLFTLTACTGAAQGAVTSDASLKPLTVVFSRPAGGSIAGAADVPTATVTPALQATETGTPTQTPTLAPDAWQSMPVVPAISANARRIYQDGLGFGNDPHAFSILGDCIDLPENFLGPFGAGIGQYHLGDYYYLQPMIDWYKKSFSRQSISNGNGFTTAAVLSPLRANPRLCQAKENPMACEYRVHKPSVAIIALGTDDNTVPPETYEKRMREIIEYTISSGVLPILTAKADNREGDYAFNRIIARLAYEYDVPMWNFWAAVQPLPLHGLADDKGHLTWGNPGDFETAGSLNHGVPMHSLSALQVLDAVWHSVTPP
jgi:hypothetical protein